MKPEERKLVGDLGKDGHVDLPWESGSSEPAGLQYDDEMPEQKEHVEGESFRDAQKRASQGEFAHHDEEPLAQTGEFTGSNDAGENVPARDWIPQRPFDSADYLDRDPVRYMSDDGEEI